MTPTSQGFLAEIRFYAQFATAPHAAHAAADVDTHLSLRGVFGHCAPCDRLGYGLEQGQQTVSNEAGMREKSMWHDDCRLSFARVMAT